jgi:hypothetical protein
MSDDVIITTAKSLLATLEDSCPSSFTTASLSGIAEF